MIDIKAYVLALAFAGLASTASAVTVVTYDFQSQPDDATSVAASGVAAGFTASSLTANGAITENVFGNHFYFSDWDPAINLSKYYSSTIGSTGGDFQLSSVDFSMEQTGLAANFYLRSSLDGFAATLGTGAFSGGIVTDFSISLAGLGTLNAPVEFRWYVTSPDGAAGFANHLPGAEGGGLPDIGQNLTFTGELVAAVPLPAGLPLAMTAMGLLLGLGRRRT